METCLRKVRFSNKYAAIAAMKRMIQEGDKGALLMVPYKCRCNGWHLGHDSDLIIAMKRTLKKKSAKLIRMGEK
jgi:hypothetical protein